MADRAPLSHEVNLFDIDAKYADVVTSDEVLAWLARVAGPARARAVG